MSVRVGCLVDLATSAGEIVETLRGANTMQTAENLRRVLASGSALNRLCGVLDALDQSLRELRDSSVE